MAKGIVIYYSRSGNTEEMTEVIAKSMRRLIKRSLSKKSPTDSTLKQNL